MDVNEEIAKELQAEREALLMAEFTPKKIQKGQVTAAKFAWMGVTTLIDIATAYAYFVILSPFWWYGVLWLFAGAGGLVFSEWLWERIGNNDDQMRIANTSKVVSAIAVLVMALFSGIALVMGWQRMAWMEAIALVSSVGLLCFHAWQAYQYHEKDDDYIAQTMDARADAQNQKEIKSIHRAGRRVAAKKVVYGVGSQYQKQHGQAFSAAAGRSFQSTDQKPPQPTQKPQQEPQTDKRDPNP